MHVTAFLKSPDQQTIGPLVALHGADRYLKQQALRALARIVVGGEDDELGITRFAGTQTDLATVCDELLTVSMWGERRLVVVEDADTFVSTNRGGLERYLQSPAKKSVLALNVKTWTRTTRLAKAVAQAGLTLECTPLSAGQLIPWIAESSQKGYQKRLNRNAAALLVELVGSELGVLDQELAKLAAYVGERPHIVADDVRAVVGGWKAETTWTMIDAIRQGRVGLALTCLDKLLVAGEGPQKLLGGINFVFRKLAHATELARSGAPLGEALRQAGFYFPHEVALSTSYLRRIGRPNAEKLTGVLLSADSDLKGSSRLAPRLQLEQLIVRLSAK